MADHPFAPFRDPELLREMAASMSRYVGAPLAIMEVCGTHTMAAMKAGLPDLLPPAVRLISGPGCPVCVTESPFIDMGRDLSMLPGVTVATFGDLMRVPGSAGSLADSAATGGKITVVYAPLDCLALCEEHPDEEFVFLSVGFETTTPAAALTILKARERGLRNLSLLTANKVMPPAMEALAADPDSPVGGFIFPGHVCAVSGLAFYEEFCRKYQIPGVVAGFEAMDMLAAIMAIIAQTKHKEPRLENLYSRVVKPEGNPEATRAVDEVFMPCDVHWRGLGNIPRSGLCLRDAYADMDAQRRYGLVSPPAHEPAGCLCPEVISGRRTPLECSLFATACTPTTPIGACMVSPEGACAAYYKYRLKS